jgi:purine-binding chemotaxis protein CheW
VVTFHLGRELCALPITDVHQIIRDTPITPVPNVNQHVEGVLNLRGIVVPIIDLKHLLALGVRQISDSHRLLIIDSGGRMVGFSVDAVGGVLEIDESRLQSAPDVVLAKVSGRYVIGVVQHGEDIVIVLDKNEILNIRNHQTADPGGGVGGRVAARS